MISIPNGYKAFPDTTLSELREEFLIAYTTYDSHMKAHKVISAIIREYDRQQVIQAMDKDAITTIILNQLSVYQDSTLESYKNEQYVALIENKVFPKEWLIIPQLTRTNNKIFDLIDDIEDFCYWDEGKKPENVVPNRWELRKYCWHESLDAHKPYKNQGFIVYPFSTIPTDTFALNIQPCDINTFIPTQEHRKQELAEFLYLYEGLRTQNTGVQNPREFLKQGNLQIKEMAADILLPDLDNMIDALSNFCVK